MAEAKLKRVCKCENCGNEAEMVVTCSLEETPETTAAPTNDPPSPETNRVQGRGVCSHCGNEADMWVDL